MTPEERQLSAELIVGLDGRRGISKEEFLRRFPSVTKSGKLAFRLLREAYDARSFEDLDVALTIASTFGIGPEHEELFCRLLDADSDWHYLHEGVVSLLDSLRIPAAIEPLYEITQWVPEYLKFDDARALAVKAIWPLGNIRSDEAEKKLATLARSDDRRIREDAEYQIKRRHGQEKSAP
jgi:hypothetical protein